MQELFNLTKNFRLGNQYPHPHEKWSSLKIRRDTPVRNPLTLLHSALSEGLHAQTDEECLEIATSIRVVMADFAERMGQALKDEAELTSAVSRLLNKKGTSAKPLAQEGASDS
jgi:hypothetical protein